tara:strand:+ start:245 stop:490 length:246 start_codon:yes stop_codon:yes gene_type:complete
VLTRLSILAALAFGSLGTAILWGAAAIHAGRIVFWPDLAMLSDGRAVAWAFLMLAHFFSPALLIWGIVQLASSTLRKPSND